MAKISIAQQRVAVEAVIAAWRVGSYGQLTQEALEAAAKTLAWIERRPELVRTIDEILQSFPEARLITAPPAPAAGNSGQSRGSGLPKSPATE